MAPRDAWVLMLGIRLLTNCEVIMDGDNNDAGSNGNGLPLHRLIKHMMPEFFTKSCDICQANFVTRDEDASRCGLCIEQKKHADKIASEASRIRDNLLVWLDKSLLRSGLSLRERNASIDHISVGIKHVLKNPTLQVLNMTRGETPKTGFGLLGPTGTGKTCALAAIIRSMVMNRWRNLADRDGMACTKQFVYWVRWPEQVNTFRTMVGSTSDGLQQCEAIARGWCSAEVLVIDDLGAERMKSDYSEDWATSILDLVIDHRYNEMLPIWYTSNLNPDELVERYGSRMFSRLIGHNPAVIAPDGPDLRVIKGKDNK